MVIFGTDECGYCMAAGRHITAALADHPGVPVYAIEDGPGRVLGRSYRVKLWPTVVFLRDGAEAARVVRPGDRAPLDEAMAANNGPGR